MISIVQLLSAKLAPGCLSQPKILEALENRQSCRGLIYVYNIEIKPKI